MLLVHTTNQIYHTRSCFKILRAIIWDVTRVPNTASVVDANIYSIDLAAGNILTATHVKFGAFA